MGLLECTSNASLWRGYDYFEEKRVGIIQKTGENSYKAIVSGSGSNSYTVEINLEHPRKSKCNCPHADGKRIICKHMTALYFSVFPQEAKRIYDEAVAYEKEEEKRQEELENSLVKYVYKMKKDDLCQALLELLYDGPEWQYERFLREYIDFE